VATGVEAVPRAGLRSDEHDGVTVKLMGDSICSFIIFSLSLSFLFFRPTALSSGEGLEMNLEVSSEERGMWLAVGLFAD
jgi:hypothetical protein